MSKNRYRQAVLAILAFVIGSTATNAQTRLTVSGHVNDPQGLALPGATVELRSTEEVFVTSGSTDRHGQFVLTDVLPGDYVLMATLLGFHPASAQITLRADRSDLQLTMEIGSFEQEITVTALMPEVATEFVLLAREVERRVVRDVSAGLRVESGVNAVRRGPINLDPTIRGLYETQIGMFVDGTRTFAAGPARMDSGISHVSPHALQAVRVVKGPYALTWGSGTLSAIQLETFKPAFSSGDFVVNGRAGFNYGANGDGGDGFVGLWGRDDRVRFTFTHNTRTGNDYEDGNDILIPGDYESFDTRWDVGFRPAAGLLVEYSGGYQKQNDVEYPGRLLDAELFETNSHAVDVAFGPGTGVISELFGQVYVNLKDHRMNNDTKPTARDMPTRQPPFGLDVGINANSDTVGGRFHALMDRGVFSYKLGFDVFRLQQDADRTIANRNTGVVLFSDTVWPDAKVTNTGGYAQVIYEQGRARLGGTLRFDHEEASAGVVSPFFAANTTGDLDGSDTSLSAAANANVRISNTWSLNLGVGRAVRQPTVLERYSDRFPSTKFQIAAEFMGNPGLVAEESTELNVGTVFRLAGATVQGDYFFRTIDNYITVVPDPTLPKRLPLSPPVVYRYINGEAARFTGYDLSVESAVGPYVAVRGGWSYVWAEDTFFDEPVFGISPFEQRYAFEVHTADRRRWVELLLTNAADQGRVAVARLERFTEGWTTLDLRAGLRIVEGFTLKVGLENITNEAYATHVNSLNPFTGERIPEIGRNFYVGAEYGF